jgi:hypothetical protein
VVAFTIRTAAGVDLALLRETSSPERYELSSGILETDGRFVLVRLQGSDRFALVVRGTSLSFDGVAVIQSADASAFALEESLP